MVDINTAIRNYRKNLSSGLGSPQLSPELLKALNVGGRRVNLGDLFPQGVPGSTGAKESQEAYENFLTGTLGIDKDKLKPSDRQTRFTKGLQTLTDFALPSLFGLGQDVKKGLAAFDPGGAKFASPIEQNLGKFLFGERADEEFFKDPKLQAQGQDILRQLSAQERRQQGQLSPLVREAAEKEKQTQAGVDTFEQGTGEDFKQDPTGKFLDPEAEAAIAQKKLDEEAEEKAKDAVLAAEDDAEKFAGQDIPLTDEEKKIQAQQTLFKEAMDDINAIYGDSSQTDKKRKTLEEYKADFAKATGIDVSGEPDNKLALMSLGLSLMQNRAGKDFNLSNIIGAAGEAGQKALPLFEKARKEARAGQIAAGKFALGETKADSLAALATAKEKRKALADISKQFRDQRFKREIEYIKHKNAMDIKRIEADLKPIDAKGKVTTTTLQGNNFLKVDTAFVTGSRNRVFLAPVQQAEKHADVYVNILEAQNSIGEVKSILQDLGKANTPSAIALLKDRVVQVLKPLGIGDVDYSKDVAKIIDEGTSPEEKIRAIQDRLISQYKKFLTKETGNGVSEGDIQRLKQLIGEIKVGQPLAENLNRLDQLSQIFAAPQRTLESQFKSFARRENYRNEEEYLKTMDIIQKAISTGTDNAYDFNIGSDGSITIDLR
jgi:hypothetical protein|tara:strand:+ start:2137 stop:4116 length:1980 start_codon:yes stop_codon:yes gene_type:complete